MEITIPVSLKWVFITFVVKPIRWLWKLSTEYLPAWILPWFYSSKACMNRVNIFAAAPGPTLNLNPERSQFVIQQIVFIICNHLPFPITVSNLRLKISLNDSGFCELSKNSTEITINNIVDSPDPIKIIHRGTLEVSHPIDSQQAKIVNQQHHDCLRLKISGEVTFRTLAREFRKSIESGTEIVAFVFKGS